MSLHPSFVRRRIPLRAFGGRVGFLIDKRLLFAGGILLAIALAILTAALASGQMRLPVADVLGVLTGGGERRTRLVVLDWRLPRAAGAVVLGALLGLGGQSSSRSPAIRSAVPMWWVSMPAPIRVRSSSSLSVPEAGSCSPVAPSPGDC